MQTTIINGYLLTLCRDLDDRISHADSSLGILNSKTCGADFELDSFRKIIAFYDVYRGNLATDVMS
jgi:hypothetical protein